MNVKKSMLCFPEFTKYDDYFIYLYNFDPWISEISKKFFILNGFDLQSLFHEHNEDCFDLEGIHINKIDRITIANILWLGVILTLHLHFKGATGGASK